MTARQRTPSVAKVVAYWRDTDPPWLRSRYIGWGEPFCFACGWLPPVDDTSADAWTAAGKWLDRAHLKNHYTGGDNRPHNLVMLCHLCHDDMPDLCTKQSALQWVQQRQPCEAIWQAWTDCRCRTLKVTRRTTLIHQRMLYLDAMRQDVAAGTTAVTTRN